MQKTETKKTRRPRVVSNVFRIVKNSTAVGKGMLRGKKDLPSMAVPLNKKISAIVQKLPRRELTPLRDLVIQKKGPQKKW